MYAEVIICYKSRALDKLLSYKIPDDMDISVGDAVMVPFGAKNTPTQGFVTGIKSSAGIDSAKIKEIKSKSPCGRMFDEKMLGVVKFMREKYLCTFNEAVSAVIPSGVSARSKEWLTLKKAASLSGKKKLISDTLLSAGGTMDAGRLSAAVGSGCAQAVSELIKSGIISRSFSEKSPVNKKTAVAVKLCVSTEEALKAASDIEKKAPKQARALSVIAQAQLLSVADLTKYSDCNASIVKALCDKGFLEKTIVETDRNPNTTYVRPDTAKSLTPEQQSAVDAINPYIEKTKFKSFLLHGVTGSGKTEVFMNTIRRVIDKGRRAVVLVPEISLTPQTVGRFRARFGDRVAVFHSALSPGEKYDQWRKMRAGDVDIVIGARSAIFAPFDDIGVIILDEEHSETYKSETAPRYSAHEVAEYRAKQYNAVLIYASATPSFETYFRAQSNEPQLLEMKSRFNKSSMPQITIADMREELKGGNKSMFSNILKEEIEKNLERGEQTILFLNRRGFSTFVSCRECGYVVHCPNCNISLTYHRHSDTLECHYCGHTVKNYTVCPSCGSKYIRYFGTGTEKVEAEVKNLFPQASVIRMDIDTTGKKQSHQKILDRFEKEKIDILIGTQMVTKGLDFENVTLVGVISADTMLNVDDFRSGERTFDILEQVTGRAGRGEKKGRAVIQTYSPEHEAVIMAAQHNFVKYYADEIRMRKILWYPPFCKLILIGFSGVLRSAVDECSKEFKKYLGTGDFTVLGPIPCAVSKVKNKYRYQILIKCRPDVHLSDRLVRAREHCIKNPSFESVAVIIDKNPIHIQ